MMRWLPRLFDLTKHGKALQYLPVAGFSAISTRDACCRVEKHSQDQVILWGDEQGFNLCKQRRPAQAFKPGKT
jgi:hypothetical protein